MEDCDAVILISPYIGDYHNGQSFLSSLEPEEIKFMEREYVVEYRKRHPSYIECLKDMKYKLGKIKQILNSNEGEKHDKQEEGFTE